MRCASEMDLAFLYAMKDGEERKTLLQYCLQHTSVPIAELITQNVAPSGVSIQLGSATIANN
jgi:hypothetical protein